MRIICFNTRGMFTIIPTVSLCWCRAKGVFDFRIVLNWADIWVELWWLFNTDDDEEEV